MDIVQQFSNGIGDNFSKKVKNILEKIKNKDFISIYAKTNIEDISNKIQEIRQLEKAIKERKFISFEYFSEIKKKIKKANTIGIINFQGYWYLIYLYKDKDVRKYYLNNIADIVILEGKC